MFTCYIYDCSNILSCSCVSCFVLSYTGIMVLSSRFKRPSNESSIPTLHTSIYIKYYCMDLYYSTEPTIPFVSDPLFSSVSVSLRILSSSYSTKGMIWVILHSYTYLGKIISNGFFPSTSGFHFNFFFFYFAPEFLTSLWLKWLFNHLSAPRNYI